MLEHPENNLVPSESLVRRGTGLGHCVLRPVSMAERTQRGAVGYTYPCMGAVS